MAKPTVEGILLDELKTIQLKLDAIRVDISRAYNHAEDAHKRLDKYGNRLVGYIVGLGGSGAAAGVLLGDRVADFVKGVGRTMFS